MTLFHPWLAVGIVLCLVVAVLPDVTEYFSLPGRHLVQRAVGETESWTLNWLRVAGLLSLVETGRWLPWFVIRALPELAVLAFVGTVIGAYLKRPRHYRTEGGGVGVEFTGIPRALLIFGVKFAGASLLIWIGGQFF